ncbi:Uncharacterised protein [Enterobacter cloacae]|uniref:Uncharacterized protein n=1 Tax=Enterobacter cloacae TaxID=550 RepID=A0A377LZA5_ENTCL|nr:Uncharacterised protein [Enterobacter cloacae]
MLFDPRAQTLNVARLQKPEQGFLLFAPAVLGIGIVMAEQRLYLAHLHTVIYPAFDLADPIDVGIIEKAVTTVRALRFE